MFIVIIMLEKYLNFNKTILKDYLKKYNYYWEVLDDLNNLILKVGETLDLGLYSKISHNIWVHKSAIIDDNCKIIGPCIIGENSEIRYNAFIRGNVIVGNNCVVGNSSEIKNSILFNEVKVPHFNYVGDSILGYKSHFGAGVITSNIKSNKSNINIVINDQVYKINKIKLGSLVGDYVEIGCNSVLNPGTVIGKNTIIYPLTMVRNEIKANSILKNDGTIADKEIKLL